MPISVPSAGSKGRVFLIDTMSFIFRAYHAMARQRPMSTRKGLPTAAIYVFVNMLRKLRDDFSPEYLAAVFDVGGPTFRDQEADAVTTVRKFDLKTQTFQEVQYHGYKANRTAMPDDLVQQVPYIRRALEAYRIPILELQGFEADDVIGTLARKAAAQSHMVYVVSSDKDMLQLVTDKVLVLNPPKDNLIADAAKVEEILGVPPERVVDVMALRGDSIDNIPGAPGIGDKGSVELIKRFGTVEQALDRAAEVERKTYKESLLNNREIVMFSKRMATIDTNVPVELDLGAMKCGEPEIDSLRALFAELEFTTLLKELLPVVQVTEAQYAEAKSAADVEAVLAALPSLGCLSIAVETVEPVTTEDELEEEASEETLLPLRAAPAKVEPLPTHNVAISASPGTATSISLTSPAASRLVAVLANAEIPKAVHDYKAALHALAPLKVELKGVQHDTRLYSYLLNPTYSSHALPDAALRRFNLKLSGNLAESADITGRLATALRSEVDDCGVDKLYEDIDLPLVRVLAQMEEAGVKIDTGALARMSTRLEREVYGKAKEIYREAGVEFNINSPKKLGDVLFNQLNLPKPVKYGKGKTISTAVDVLEDLAENHPVARMVLEYRQLAKLKSTYVDTLPALLSPATGRLQYDFPR